MSHDKNMQSNSPLREVLKTQFNYFASLTTWLSVDIGTKWL